MRAVIVKSPGDASQLYLGDYDQPVPKDHEVLVKVKCFALNRMDLLQREGKYPVPPGASPILGVEVSGIIERVGKDVSNFKPGDAVFGLMPGGGYAQYAVLHESLTMHKPDALSFEEAAAIPETWFTAYQALFFVGQLKKGQDVLIHAGASGVGIAAIQLAKEAGANRIFVTVGSDDKVKFCQSIGATKAINYKTENWSDVILNETSKKGVDVLIDFIGKDYWNQNIQVLGLDGHMVILAFMSGTVIEKFDISVMLRKRIKIEGSNLRARSVEYQTKLRDAIYEHAVSKHFAKKQDAALKIFIDKIFNWEDIIDAHKYLESNQSMGKIVIKVTEHQ
ncbi:NADPH:quinone reductase-like protein [Gilbertella persicaria]|uniref:NADPH:quinone reductase-like protein n=1 Tax=Gilbertella persicaria TaxID=101096 RepID=UPI00221EF07C|nr:NADPH:quinone reductase-like protein [Gilbertella persicaria]KAI8066257.1 NADPH:quinone reductase-like protein [Gilbertella persicaria]